MSLNQLSSIRQDWNKQLNRIRAQINKEVREKCLDALGGKENE